MSVVRFMWVSHGSGQCSGDKLPAVLLDFALWNRQQYFTAARTRDDVDMECRLAGLSREGGMHRSPALAVFALCFVPEEAA